MKLLLDRSQYEADSTVGDLYVDGVWECLVMEPGLHQLGHPAIPVGTYTVILSISPRFNRVLPLICDVPERDGIRIHPGNRSEDTLGCLLPGESLTRIGGHPFLEHSAIAFSRLNAKLEDADGPITLEVVA